MNQTVYYPTLRIELRQKRVKKTPVAIFVAAPSGVRDKVGQLNQARSAGVNEQGNLSEVAKFPPATAVEAKMPREGLNGFFVFRIVHDNQTALIAFPAISVPCSTVSTLQKQIEPIAQFLECDFDGILRRYRGTIHGHGE